MSQQLISRSPDLRRLRDEGYEVEISGSNYLLIHNVPYVNSTQAVARATLASELTLAGDRTAPPSTHVVLFTGDYPCQQDGSEIAAIRHNPSTELLAPGFPARFSFSNKPGDGYPDYYAKMTRYIDIISHPAKSIDAAATAQTYRPIPDTAGESVFNYLDTASSRVGISALSDKLKIQRIAIIGVGGTGSYVLDLVAKTPVAEIHLFDRDAFLQHNAFRSPGAPAIEAFEPAPKKVDYLRGIYANMRRGIVAHRYNIDASNVGELADLTFVFLCLDKASAKEPIAEFLETRRIPFVDVGMGVELIADDQLIGILRITTSTADKREHVRAKQRISFLEAEGHDDYARNIQIAELNAMNAALAVIKWKKLLGFYQDLEQEHYSTYSINVNLLTSDDRIT